LNPTFTNVDLTGEAIKEEPKKCRENKITDTTRLDKSTQIALKTQ
jgi:hypothetical protein